MSKASLRKKLIICLLLPLFFQFFFLISLYQIGMNIDALASSERKRFEFLHQLDKLSLLLETSFGSLLNLSNPLNYARDEANPDHLDEVNKQLFVLSQLAKTDRELDAQVGELKSIVDQQIHLLVYLHAVPLANRFEAFVNQPQVQRNIQNFSLGSKKIQQSVERQEGLLQAERQRLVTLGENFKILIAVGAALDFFIGVILGYALIADVVHRLKLLMGNAEKVFETGTLDAIKGNDEITKLNQILVSSRDRLNDSHQKRNAILQMVTHDLRSPLSSILISVENLLTRASTESSTDQCDQLTRIKDCASKMSTLTEDLLLLESIEGAGLTFEPSEIDVRAVISKIVRNFTEQAGKKNVRLINLCGDYIIQADERRFEQILENLIGNAIKFSSPGSSVEISAKTLSKAVQFSVLDQGAGMSKRDMERIFEKFHRAKNTSAQGFGVGLAIVKALVEGQGGSVGVESTIGKGSRFWFTLPLQDFDP